MRRTRPLTGLLTTLPLLACLVLSGCTVIGGYVGYQKDSLEVQTRIVPVPEAATLRKGSMVFLTIPNQETMKGRFQSLSSENGKQSIHLSNPDGESRIGLGDVTEIVEEYRDNDKLIKGTAIGVFVDAALLGSFIWFIRAMDERTMD